MKAGLESQGPRWFLTPKGEATSRLSPTKRNKLSKPLSPSILSESEIWLVFGSYIYIYIYFYEYGSLQLLSQFVPVIKQNVVLILSETMCMMYLEN